MPKSRLAKVRKWVLRSLAVIVLIGLIAGIAAWYYAGPYAQGIIHAKLQRIVSSQLNAELQMGTIEYAYPYGVTVDEVALVADPSGKAVTLASFKRLRLQLTELPFGDGPLKIESIEVDEPTIHLIRTPDGFVGRSGLVRDEQEKLRRNAPKLSEIFLLRHLQLSDARVMYEDVRQPDQQPLVWQEVNVEINSTPTGASHAFQFTANTGDLASISSTGKLDLDSLILDLESLAITSHVSPDQSKSPLPPAITQVLTRYGITGNARIDITGQISIREPEKTNAKVSVAIENATAQYDELPDPLQDLDVNLSAAYADGDINLKLDFLSARSGSMGVSVQPFNVLMTVATRKWTASAVRLAAAYAPTERTKSILSQSATLFIVARGKQIGEPTDIAIDLSGSSLTLPNLNDELKLTGGVEFHDPVVSIPAMTIVGLGGRAELAGTLDIKSLQSNVNAKAEALSLASLKVLMTPTADRELKGNLTGDVSAQMRGMDLSSVVATGEGRIADAAFARVPVLSDIANFLKIGKGMFVAENAFARFKVRDRKVIFDRLGVRTDVVRVRGQGEIGFDEKLDLHLYVIGTGDWGQSIKSTGIPVVSDLAGALAGGAQSVIRGVTTQFTSLRVTGTIAKPIVLPDPAPAITDTVKKLFASDEK